MSLWLLIDGNNYVHRNVRGAGPDDGVRLFGLQLDALITFLRPVRVMVAFDSEKSFRAELFAGYKAGRQHPEGLDVAMKAAVESCIDHSVDYLTHEGAEADDLIATWTRMARENETRVVIASSDRDMHQLIVDGAVCQLTKCPREFGRLNPEWMNGVMLRDRFGVTAEQWVEYRMLVGDKSDNLHGIHGFGRKNASRLLQRCGSLDGFFRSPFQAGLNDRLRSRLMGSRSELQKLRELVTLRDELPMPEGWLAAA